jgi:Spy/CpxP family protein refolding chaperone
MMHPGMAWWRRAHGHGGCGPSAGCGPSGARGGGWEASDVHDGDFGSGAFGVRRPLRFLAWKLELEEKQVAALAAILDELKTERAQAAVDDRRTRTALADAVAGATFDAAKAKEAGDLRVTSAERLRDAVVRALERIHAVLDAEQRERLAYLVRTGALLI